MISVKIWKETSEKQFSGFSALTDITRVLWVIEEAS